MFIENSNELAQNKLILIYIFDKVDYPMTNSEITQFVLENNHMNYFVVQQYLSELVDSEFLSIVTKDGNEYYNITSKGREVLNYFSERIPNDTKNIIQEKYLIKQKEKIKETQILGNYYKKNESEFIVNLKVIENEITLFNLSLNVVSKKQAKMICNNWKENPENIYKQFIDLLTEDKN
ncbi:DUF4364 family protein [Clostridium sp. D2Q-11]|uniref:DUF4364 family protein n=1 Tax=Anaeromonas frigoriresistens TaxID=2683708 RepID=A0A942UV99_9FIRM|nr:DUF4364 family protein [Anaeromonas frigoriresistens]MBS4539233.1 DUF4364 family protein [Anaeromonas frigoriresistens]